MNYNLTILPRKHEPRSPQASLVLGCWNIGYGGMGASSEFKVDGGKRWLPPSRRDVSKNVDGIKRILQGRNIDVFICQEIASAQLANYWVSVGARISEPLASHSRVYSSDFKVGLSRFVMGAEIQNAVFAAATIKNSECIPLPNERRTGVMHPRKTPHIQKTTLKPWSDDHEFVIMNIHLSTFDPDAKLDQLKVVLRVAEEAYDGGRRSVVVAGDWNLRLVKTQFPHDVESQANYQFWLQDLDDVFARGRLSESENFRFVAPRERPSVRLVHEPYRPGMTYTCTVDGYYVSNNLDVGSCTVPDPLFEYSDHNLVLLKVKRQISGSTQG